MSRPLAHVELNSGNDPTGSLVSICGGFPKFGVLFFGGGREGGGWSLF